MMVIYSHFMVPIKTIYFFLNSLTVFAIFLHAFHLRF